MWHIYRPIGNLLTSLAELFWFKPGLPGCLTILPLMRLLTSFVQFVRTCEEVKVFIDIFTHYAQVSELEVEVAALSNRLFLPHAKSSLVIDPLSSHIQLYSLRERPGEPGFVCATVVMFCLVWPFVIYCKGTNL